ncbi:MAG: response regulator [Lachnospiraceae bacterium]|jgi:two-component system CheB/CheR fusion protein|nr:response regulator [Lachnospiraceae bacterium]
MSEEFQKKMFAPFEQESEFSRSRSLGQGLGLYIVKYLVDAMDGRISCASTKGQGTTFTVSLDYDVCTGEIPTENESEKTALKILTGKRVLICEDQAINAEIAESMLEHFGMQGEICANGREGIEKFRNSKQGYYSAVLMDLRMPVVDGREATLSIRAQKRPDAQTIPIIIMTADVFAEDRTDLLQAGATDFVYKPVDMILLRDVLSKYLKEEPKAGQ